jgi:hypothetical protein
MTPKEKAVELYNKYEQLGKDFTRGVSMAEFAKQCALIVLQEMIKLLDELPMSQDVIEQFAYLQEVKKEIEKL